MTIAPRRRPITSGSPAGVVGASMAQGLVVGTLEYMAPEQARGENVDQRADIYAFGMILSQMLLRRASLPEGMTPIEALWQRIGQPPVSLRESDAAIPEPVDAIVLRCLQVDPENRFATTADLVAALDRLDDDGNLIPEPVVRRFTPRLIATAVDMTAAIVTGTWWLTRTPPAPKQHEPVSVLIADFQNQTGDPTFDRTLEPMIKRALEGAGFISAHDQQGIRDALGVQPPDKLDEAAARELAVKQGVGVVLSGSIDRQGNGYAVTVKTIETVTGKVISTAKGRAPAKDQVLASATKLMTTVRTALGDNESGTAQMFAMASISATSPEVVRYYAAAREASSHLKFEEAKSNYAKAVELDPKFGIGYEGLAGVSLNQGNLQEAEKYVKEALRYVDGMTERERYTTRGLYYTMTGDYQQCAQEYSDLITRYPAEVLAHHNLALCLSYLRNMPRALDEVRRLTELMPKRALFRINLALYANYASEFPTGERAARTVRELGREQWGLFTLALAQLGQGQLAQAASTYEELAKIEGLGASRAASGLGDLAIQEGRFSEAVRILERGAGADLQSKIQDKAAAKFAAIAQAQVLRQQKAAAIVAADRALANSKAMKIRFLVGRIFIEAGEIPRARTLIAELASEIHAEPQAYAKVLEGEVALKSGDARQAIKFLTDANTLLDPWIGHFDLGRAYLGASLFAQADSELDRCITRRGEALALFLDEEVTYAFFPPVYYYQGRVREAMNTEGFVESYRAYLKIRGKSTEDPLLPEVRRRAGR